MFKGPSLYTTVLYLLATSSLICLQTVRAASPLATELPATHKNNDMVNNMQSEWTPVTGHQQHPNNNSRRGNIMHAIAADSTTTGGPTSVGEYVATTPKIDILSTKAPSRYERTSPLSLTVNAHTNIINIWSAIWVYTRRGWKIYVRFL